MLCSLHYPLELLDVVLGEDGSTDKTFETASEMALLLTSCPFHSVTVHRFEDLTERHPPFDPRSDKHQKTHQAARRANLARARNHLLSLGLGDAQLVLWLDSDLKYIPPQLLKIFVAADYDVVTSTCLYQRREGPLALYDRNSWRETNSSLTRQMHLSKDSLVLEGYEPTTDRLYITSLRREGPFVRLDGVGGCALAVKARCHRDGLIFPPYPYRHHIETEGLAKMAQDMGLGLYGMPQLYVVHA